MQPILRAETNSLKTEEVTIFEYQSPVCRFRVKA